MCVKWISDDSHLFSVHSIISSLLDSSCSPRFHISRSLSLSLLCLYPPIKVRIDPNRVKKRNDGVGRRTSQHSFFSSNNVADMYAKIESERLLFVRLNKKKLRVDNYIYLRDAIANVGKVTSLDQLVIVPLISTGSPRHMHEYTQDAMICVRNYGRPAHI